MSLYEHHIFVCTNERNPHDPRGCCSAKGSEEILEAFRAGVRERGLKGKVRANKAGCLDQCAYGPVIVIYPEGVWYSNVTALDVPEILDALTVRKTVKRLLHPKVV